MFPGGHLQILQDGEAPSAAGERPNGNGNVGKNGKSGGIRMRARQDARPAKAGYFTSPIAFSFLDSSRRSLDRSAFLMM